MARRSILGTMTERRRQERRGWVGRRASGIIMPIIAHALLRAGIVEQNERNWRTLIESGYRYALRIGENQWNTIVADFEAQNRDRMTDDFARYCVQNAQIENNMVFPHADADIQEAMVDNMTARIRQAFEEIANQIVGGRIAGDSPPPRPHDDESANSA